MRITKDTLLSIARETAEKTARRNRDVVAIYLTGSLLTDSPLLGGTTDIDLVYVHATTPPLHREIIRLTDEVHLDIAHLGQSAFVQPRGLRKQPWLGSQLSQQAKSLHDTNHWFEFVQSSAGALFMTPENIMARSRAFASEARTLWSDLTEEPAESYTQSFCDYLQALELAANSIAVLSGNPLAERRFIQQFPERTLALGRPEFSADLLNLFFPDSLDPDKVSELMPDWKAAFLAAGKLDSAPVRLSPLRLPYYEAAVTVLNKDNAAAAWWPMLRTWAKAAAVLPVDSAPANAFIAAVDNLQLGSADMKDNLSALDGYLDALEEFLDHWSEREGV
ncbi:MAG TPA: hypothetical protein PKD55_11415 [Bellilinea sp.]|nr:hypothetical protein [Bellilinea sp.]